VTRVLDVADPAREEEAGEFQGRLLGASVSVIVVRVRDATPRRRGVEVPETHPLRRR
jgi:hypothetical protein